MKITIVLSAVCALLIYLMSAFVAWDWNPGAWDFRGSIAITWGVMTIYIAAFWSEP